MPIRHVTGPCPCGSEHPGFRFNPRDAFGRPQCAKCERPVETVLHEHDVTTAEHTFTALCHGERQEVRIYHTALAELVSMTFDLRLFGEPTTDMVRLRGIRVGPARPTGGP